MNRLLMNFIACGVIGLAGCAGPARPKSVDYNPMPGIWAKIVSDINQLEASGARKAEWSAMGEVEVHEVKDGEQLERILVYAPIPDDQKANARELLKRGYEMAEFGYPGDFHAFVIFEHDRPKFVIRW